MSSCIEARNGAGPAGPPEVADRLRVERLPGESGPVLRCFGELTGETAGVLRRELDRLEPMGHRMVTVNLAGCDYLDVDGLMVLLQACCRRREAGTRMALVAGGGIAGRLLRVLGIDRYLPVFPREAVAALALRGAGPRAPAPDTWEEARQETLERWRTIRETLSRDPEEALRLITSMFALCDLSEELFEARDRPAHARCGFCPLFYSLGARQQDLGCRSALDPLLDAVRAGDQETARAGIDGMMRLIAEMPLPRQAGAPTLARPARPESELGVLEDAEPLGTGDAPR